MKEEILFALIFGLWAGFLIGILVSHYFHKKNYPPLKKFNFPKKPDWCMSRYNCINHVCINFPKDCMSDSRHLTSNTNG
jgi:hypothetical protein